jgi:ATP/maltotriose-dependent transcriptional regulator MalT
MARSGESIDEAADVRRRAREVLTRAALGGRRSIPWQRSGTMPVPPRRYVPRDRLWDRLDEVTRLGVTVVTGPTGAGKTLGIAGWVRDRGHHLDGAVWLQADADLTPPRLEAVLDRAAEGLGPGPSARRLPRLVVIDGADELPPSSVRFVDERLLHEPTSMRLLLAGRRDVPLTRLVPELLGFLTVIRGDLLRMSNAEATALVAAHLRDPDPEVVREIVALGQGWCAVLVLAARALSSTAQPAAVRRLAEGAVPVADQVASEVFSALSSPQRHLLLCVSDEPPFTARLAAHLSHDANAADVLNELERTGLLVTRVPAATSHLVQGEFPIEYGAGAVDDRFVVHPLMREVVRRRLATQSVDVVRATAAVTRAVRLDLAGGYAPESLRRLLRLHADDEAAALLARDGIRMLLDPHHGEDVAGVARTHPEVVDAHPATWFAVALAHWLADDGDAVRRWTNRMVSGSDHSPVQLACVHLWRAKLGLEPLGPAVEQARRISTDAGEELEPRDDADDADDAADDAADDDADDALARPVLVLELATALVWLGELEEARACFASAMSLCRSHGLASLAAITISHLALAEYMDGHDRAAAELATEAFGILGEEDAARVRFAQSRAGLALFLGDTVALPWRAVPVAPPFGEAARHTHSGDLTGRYWSRARDALLAAWSGSMAAARSVLDAPVGDPRLRDGALPQHVRLSLLVGRALLAAMSADPDALRASGAELSELGAAGEERFVAGLLADCQGDRTTALDAFSQAGREATCVQPPVRAMAQACSAQLLDALGDGDGALDLLSEAAAMTELRHNGVPFLGWSRLGTPVEWLLRWLDARGDTAWTHELAELTAGHADVISSLEYSTPLRHEQRDPQHALVGPVLSPREREVLGELARGATYADIAATLFVSANTVKTHVSSLYTKLGVSRRSDALNVARSHHIL